MVRTVADPGLVSAHGLVLRSRSDRLPKTGLDLRSDRPGRSHPVGALAWSALPSAIYKALEEQFPRAVMVVLGPRPGAESRLFGEITHNALVKPELFVAAGAGDIPQRPITRTNKADLTADPRAPTPAARPSPAQQPGRLQLGTAGGQQYIPPG